MITDAETRFSDGQALTSAGTVTATNVYDCGNAQSSVGEGEPMELVAKVRTAFAGGTSIQAKWVQSDNADLSSSDDLVSGAAVVTASLTAGATLLRARIPDNSKRYVGVKYVVVGTFTAGDVDADLVHHSDTPDYNDYTAEVGKVLP